MVSRILETGKNDIRARLTPGHRLLEERENMRGMTGKSIRRQLQEIIVLAIVIFAILCALINQSMKQLMYSNADEYTKIEAARLEGQLDLAYDKMKNFCSSIGENEAVRKFLGSSYAEISGNIQAAMQCLISHKILEPTIEDISLVNDNIHYSAVYSYEKLDEMRRRVDEAPFVWLGIEPHEFAGAEGRSDMLVYAGDVIVDGNNLGTVIISMNLTYLQIEAESETSSSYMLVNGETMNYPLNCPEEIAASVYEIWTKAGGQETVKKMPYYIHSTYFEEMDCYLLSALNVKEIGGGLMQVRTLIWGCMLLVITFCVSLFWLINREMVRPLHLFNDTMRRIRKLRQRHLQEELQLEGCAEIREIGREFSGMLTDIEGLNKQIFKSATDLYELKVQKQMAELAYLRSQIDPHFLYNTLEVIRKMALVKDAPEIARMVVDMGAIFRYSTKGSYEVALEEEISIIKAYIRIQQMRFQGKIEVCYFISEEVYSLQVIKMLLQPIVENSIFHGLEPKSGEGCLYIGARQEGDRLIITVKDDGVGIEAGRLAELKEALRSENVDTSRHVGILNTNARIQLQYGTQYGLCVESREMDGTTITMELPVIKI